MNIFHYTPHAIVTALLGLVSWLGKRFLSDIKDKAVAVVDKVDATHDLIKVQNENHLTHIEEATRKTWETLEEMRVEQAATNGYLRAIIDSHKQ